MWFGMWFGMYWHGRNTVASAATISIVILSPILSQWSLIRASVPGWAIDASISDYLDVPNRHFGRELIYSP